MFGDFHPTFLIQYISNTSSISVFLSLFSISPSLESLPIPQVLMMQKYFLFIFDLEPSGRWLCYLCFKNLPSNHHVLAQRKLNVQNPSLPCTTTQQGGSLIKLHRIQNLIVESPKCPAYSRKSLVIPRTEKIKAWKRKDNQQMPTLRGIRFWNDLRTTLKQPHKNASQALWIFLKHMKN